MTAERVRIVAQRLARYGLVVAGAAIQGGLSLAGLGFALRHVVHEWIGTDDDAL